jgi:hypothetical protein
MVATLMAGNGTKRNLRAGGNWRARRDNAPAKTPAVHILTISNVSSDLLDAINELAAGQDRSRSSFVQRELPRIGAGYRAKGSA